MGSIRFQLKQILAVVLSASLIGSIVPPISAATTGVPEPLHKQARTLADSLGKEKSVQSDSASLAIEPRAGFQQQSTTLAILGRSSAGFLPTVRSDNPKPIESVLAKSPKVDPQVLAQMEGSREHGLEFVENRGQFDSRVKFRASRWGKTLWVTKTGIVFDFLRNKPFEGDSSSHRVASLREVGQPTLPGMRDVMDQEFVGVSSEPVIETKGIQQGTFNYFSGSDSSKWSTEVRRYSEIVYHDLWQGIDLRLYGNGADLEQEFIVKPGADPNRVRVAYRGIDKLEVAPDGSLLVDTAGGQVPCPHAFVAKLNPTAPPGQSLIYSTYVGGTEFDLGTGIAVDNAGNAFLTGTTQSLDFPVTAGAFQTYPPAVGPLGNANVSFVAKLNAAGSSLLYSTYIEPVCAVQPCIQENVNPSGITVDAFGNAYVTGSFRALIINLPTTPDAFQNNYNSKLSGDFSESFLMKFNAAGSALLYGSYLGGEGDDGATAVAVDQNGDAYVVGHTSSATFPITPGAFQPVRNGTGDAFVTKFPLGTVSGVSITGIVPGVGGNSGTVTAYITGIGLQPNATLELVCAGQATVVASNVNVSADGRTITGTFDLTGTNPGACSVEVINPDGTSASASQPFTVQAGGAPDMWIDIIV